MVKDALVVLLDNGVPNAIPGNGFPVVIKINSSTRKKIGKRFTKTWNQVQWGDDEVWFVPAWSLLQLADAIDQPKQEEAA